jgi:hypothetical protein
LAIAAFLAIALGAVGSALAQQQEQQDQSTQSQQQDEKKQSSQDTSDQQSGQQASESTQDTSTTDTTQRTQSTSETQSDSQSAQDQQQRDQQRQERQRQRQGQQGRQQERQDQQPSRQWRDRDQSSWSETGDRQGRFRAQRGSDRWPNPERDNYGSDSLQFRNREQWTDSDSSFSRDSQRGASRQAGLGVQVASDGERGVVVLRVHSGSPAEEMGIRERDRITAVNGREVQSVQHFISRIRGMDPGQQVQLDIRRASGGDQQTLRGELESRGEALADVDRRQQSYGYQEQGGYETMQDRDSRQTSYEERGEFGSSQGRSGQLSSQRVQQLERQIDRMRRELDNLRASLQEIRRDGQSGQYGRERTARYDEYEDTTQGQSDSRDGQSYRGEQRSASRGSGQYDGGREEFDEGPAGEIGSDRQSVGSENIDRN